MNKFKLAAGLLIAFQTAFAQGGLSKKCLDEILDIPNANRNFVLQEFIKDLPTTVIKVKGQAKAGQVPLIGGLLGPGPNDKKTELGITIGCMKEFPESPDEIKTTLMSLSLNMAKGIAANKLGVAKEEVPSDIGQLKDFTVNVCRRKAGEALGTEASEIPTNLKGLEAFVSKELRNQAVSKLGVAKGDIPKEKSEFAPFVEKAAKKKIASELKIPSSKIDFSSQGLQNITNGRQDLVPVVNMMKAANYLSVLSMVSALDVLGTTGESGGDDKDEALAASGSKRKTSSEGTAQSDKSEEEEYATFHIDWDNI
jgi:hypothetical protein